MDQNVMQVLDATNEILVRNVSMHKAELVTHHLTS